MVTRFADSLRTDNCPQPNEAQPRSHALTSDQYNILTSSAHGLFGPERALLTGAVSLSTITPHIGYPAERVKTPASTINPNLAREEGNQPWAVEAVLLQPHLGHRDGFPRRLSRRQHLLHRPVPPRRCSRSAHSDAQQLRIATSGVSGGSRGRFATPANFPLHDRSPYSRIARVHVRRGSQHGPQSARCKLT
jgi:hypothetical protein